MDVYNNIRNLREDNDLTQSELASKLNISQRAYSHYENGTREIPISILIHLSNYYDVSIDYLLGESDAKYKFHKSDKANSDSIVITKQDSPYLYKLLSETKTLSDAKIKQLIIYAKELKKAKIEQRPKKSE